MAVDFGIGNTSRYYTTPDDASFTLPDGDWTIISVAQSDVGDSNAQYLVSTGNAPPTANSMHLMRHGGTDRGAAAYNTVAVQVSTSGSVTSSGLWYIYVATRISNMLYCKTSYIDPANRTSVATSVGTSISGSTSNGGALIHGGRGDLASNRFLRGKLSWNALLIGKGLSDSEILDLQDGTTVLLDAPYAASVQNVWYFDSSSSSTIVDLVGGKIATKVGTGFGADVADPILPFAAAASVFDAQKGAVSVVGVAASDISVQADNATVGGIAVSGVNAEVVGVEISIDHAVDNCNINPATISITGAGSSNPDISLQTRPALDSITAGFRHFYFAVDGGEGRTPTFRVEWTGRVGGDGRASGWRPVYTQDHITWVQATSVTLSGGYQVFSFPGPLPSGRIYVSSNFTGRQADADALAADLLSTHASIASPLPSADVGGVYNTTPAENDDLGRAIGSKPQYAIKLDWGGSTSDGRRKRIAILDCGMHAAGEQQAWATFKSSIDWLINDSSPEAARIRQNFEIYLYFNINANGIAQGNSRGKISKTSDPNRDFVGGAWAEIAAFKSAVLADTSGVCDVYFEYHGDVFQTKIFHTAFASIDADEATRSSAASAMLANAISEFGTSPALQSQTPNTTGLWFHRYLVNAEISMSVENPAFGITTQANYDSVASKWMRALSVTDSQGHLAIPRPMQQDIINLGVVNSTRFYHIPTPSNYWIPASTDFCMVTRVYKAPGAQNGTPSYLISGGAFGASDSFSVFTAASTGSMSFTFNSALVLAIPGGLPEGTWATIALSRVGSSITIKSVYEGSSSVNTSAAATSSSACNFADLVVGGRTDLDVQRFWRGAIDGAFIITGDSVTDGELIDIAAGNVRIPSRLAGNVIFDLPGTSDVDGKVTEQVQSAVIPLSGTGWPLEDAPLPLSIVVLDATKASVSTTGKQAELLTGELFDDAVAGVVALSGFSASTQSYADNASNSPIVLSGKPASLITAHPSHAVKGAVSVTGAIAELVNLLSDDATPGAISISGKSAELIDSVAEILNAATGSIAISGRAALLQDDIINAISDSVIISGKSASVEWHVLDAASGDISIVAVPAWASEQAEILEAVKASLSISGNQAIMADSKIIILPRSRMLIITK